MRITTIIFLMMLSFAGLSLAATVDLTDGRSIQGSIVSQDNKSLQIMVDGVTMTYYADEIKDIDGKPFVAQATPPVAAPADAQNPSASTGSIDPVKKALILKFIDVFGTRQALNSNFDTMLKQIAKAKPDEADKIRQQVKIDELIDRLVPIYDRNFTSEDLEAFITFYGSPEGKKLLSTIPELMKESVQESIKYMQEKFPEAN